MRLALTQGPSRQFQGGHRAGATANQQAVRRHLVVLPDHTPLRIQEYHVEGEPHAQGVYRRAGLEQQPVAGG